MAEVWWPGSDWDGARYVRAICPTCGRTERPIESDCPDPTVCLATYDRGKSCYVIEVCGTLGIADDAEDAAVEMCEFIATQRGGPLMSCGHCQTEFRARPKPALENRCAS